MAINPFQFKAYVLVPALQDLESIIPCDQNSIDLMMETPCPESDFLTNWAQFGGPAKNPYGIEPGTFEDIWNRYLKPTNPKEEGYERKISLRDMIIASSNTLHGPVFEDLTYNLRLCIQIARLRYYMVPEKIPSTLQGRAEYWKQHYNTPTGKGTVEEYIAKAKKYVIQGLK